MPVLPPAFADLEPFTQWSLATEKERFALRLASSLDELQAFYDAALPRLDEAVEYLDQFELDDLPADATRLIWMYYSLMTVSFPVEVWRQPRVPDSGASSFDCILDLKP
jgi:hypothetical protein